MHKSKYTVTHTHARYVSVYVRISSYEKSPFRPPALISQNVAADPFFYVLRAFPLLFFFSSLCCFVFMPNHCHYNMEHGDSAVCIQIH